MITTEADVFPVSTSLRKRKHHHMFSQEKWSELRNFADMRHMTLLFYNSHKTKLQTFLLLTRLAQENFLVNSTTDKLFFLQKAPIINVRIN